MRRQPRGVAPALTYQSPTPGSVSGLPLLTQRPLRRQRLLLGCLRQAEPGAPFVQFTYFYRSPIPTRADLVASDVSPVIWRNLWPARVWRYRLPTVPAASLPS